MELLQLKYFKTVFNFAFLIILSAFMLLIGG